MKHLLILLAVIFFVNPVYSSEPTDSIDASTSSLLMTLENSPHESNHFSFLTHKPKESIHAQSEEDAYQAETVVAFFVAALMESVVSHFLLTKNKLANSICGELP